MSKIKEFENIPDIDIEGEETLEEAVADCKALFGKYNKELFNGEVSLERCSEARLVLLTLSQHGVQHGVSESGTAAYEHGAEFGQPCSACWSGTPGSRKSHGGYSIHTVCAENECNRNPGRNTGENGRQTVFQNRKVCGDLTRRTDRGRSCRGG